VALVFGGWVFPVGVHWVWSSEGWLSARREAGGPVLGANGLIDLAGSGAVHVAAGAAALAGAYAVGARRGRFVGSGGGGGGGAGCCGGGGNGDARPLPASSMLLVAAGVLMRW
jgi:ammonia channel protein AmtB